MNGLGSGKLETQKIHVNFRNFHNDMKQKQVEWIWNPRWQTFSSCFKRHNMQLVYYVVLTLSCCCWIVSLSIYETINTNKMTFYVIKAPQLWFYRGLRWVNFTQMKWLQVKGHGHGWFCNKTTFWGDGKKVHVASPYYLMIGRDMRPFYLRRLVGTRQVDAPNHERWWLSFPVKIVHGWRVNVRLILVCVCACVCRFTGARVLYCLEGDTA